MRGPLTGPRVSNVVCGIGGWRAGALHNGAVDGPAAGALPTRPSVATRSAACRHDRLLARPTLDLALRELGHNVLDCGRVRTVIASEMHTTALRPECRTIWREYEEVTIFRGHGQPSSGQATVEPQRLQSYRRAQCRARFRQSTDSLNALLVERVPCDRRLLTSGIRIRRAIAPEPEGFS